MNLMNKKTSTLRSTVLLFFISTIFSSVLPGSDVDDIVKKVRKKYESIKTLHVEFTMTSYWALTGREETLTGTLSLEGDNRYRIETDTQIIVTDGKTLWTYTKNSNQLIIDRLSPSKENPLPRDLLLSYTKDHRAELKGEVTYGGTPCYELIFRPREDDAFIVQTRVMVDKKTWLAVLFEQEDINENRTRYELRKFSINTPLSPSLFTFTAPEQAEIIDMR